MAQYADDFGSYADDTLPSGWTARLDSASWLVKSKAGLSSGKALEISNPNSGNLSALTLDAMNGVANGEIVARLRTSSLATNQSFNGVVCRLQENGDCVYMRLNTTSGGAPRIQVREVVGGSASTLGSTTALAFGADEFVWFRISVDNDGSIIAKAWLGNAEDEDGATNIPTVSTFVADPGAWGAGHWHASAIGDWDFMGFGDGEAAPKTPPLPSLALEPSGTISADTQIETTGADHHSVLTDDNDATYIQNDDSRTSGEVWLELSDTPSDFAEMVSLTLKARVRRG